MHLTYVDSNHCGGYLSGGSARAFIRIADEAMRRQGENATRMRISSADNRTFA